MPVTVSGKTFQRRRNWTALRQKMPMAEAELMALYESMGFKPFDLQKEILLDRHRYKCLAIGRRWGKSFVEAADSVAVACFGGHVWCVAPTFNLADIIFDHCLELCADPKLPVHKMISKINTGAGAKMIQTITGGLIVPKSSDHPGSLIGRGIDKIVFDEAAKESDPRVLTKYLTPCVSNTEGSIDLITTPEGKNWLYYEFLKGVNDPNNTSYDPAYRSWTCPSRTSPHFSQREWDFQKVHLPEDIFNQEYGAEFLDDGGQVFKNIRECSTSTMLESPNPGRMYVMGVDLAKSQDWTVITIMDANARSVAYIERFNQIDWEIQKVRIRDLAYKWMCPVLIDSTGVGDPILSALIEMGLPMGVNGYFFTLDSKNRLVMTLSLAFQNHEISIIPDPIALHEFEIYGVERLPSGKFRYNAPSGYHDDIVISHALAYELCLRHGYRDGGDALIEREESRGVQWS